MCTDLRLVRLPQLHVSARTLDFAYETHSRVQVVPRGQQFEPTLTHTVTRGFAADSGPKRQMLRRSSRP